MERKAQGKMLESEFQGQPQKVHSDLDDFFGWNSNKKHSCAEGRGAEDSSKNIFPRNLTVDSEV